jgi:uncharacterized glyoxalase superfamily protein PhnB
MNDLATLPAPAVAFSVAPSAARSPLLSPPAGMPRIAPHLFYRDVAAAADWLAGAFGFTCRLRIANDAGVVVHAELEVYDGLVMLGLAREHAHWASPLDLGARMTHRLFIYVDDVDVHHARASAAGARITIAPSDQWHGERVYEAADLEGHRWKFAHPIFEVNQTQLKRPPTPSGHD